MTERSIRWIALPGSFLLVLAAAAAVRARLQEPAGKKDADASRPSLTGTWRLNPDESENLRDKMREAFRGRRRGGGMRGPGGGGMGGPGGGMGGPGGGYGRGGGRGPGDGPGRGPGMMEQLEAGIDRLTIQQDEPKVFIVYADDHDRTFYTDGRKVKRSGPAGDYEQRAEWKDGKVVVEEKSARGGGVTETYELAPGGRKLTVTTRIERGRGPSVSVRRVYDAAAEEPEGGR